ncbi:MAG: hypothetical protein ACXU8N_15095 [Telluria sp.]
MTNAFVMAVLYVTLGASAEENATPPKVGEVFTIARVRLLAAGWAPDPGAHLASGEWMGLDRDLMEAGYPEVDFCSVDTAQCVLQYVKDSHCVRLQTRGEAISTMVVENWTSECRTMRPDEPATNPPADVRYLTQWRKDCEEFGHCRGMDRFLRNLKKKYAGDPVISRLLK